MSQVNLTWEISTGSPIGYIVQRSIGNTSSFSILATASVNSYQDSTTVLTGSVIDLLTTSSYYYRIYAFNSSKTSSYSNIIKVPSGVVETWDEYSLGRTGSFGSGSGDWVGIWKIDDRIRFISGETFDSYAIGTTGSFNGVYGWIGGWILTNSIQTPISTETFDNYPIGITGSFISGSGWIGGWILTNSIQTPISTDMFDSYTIGQTTTFNLGNGWIGIWETK